jgi:hypothetical protein
MDGQYCMDRQQGFYLGVYPGTGWMYRVVWMYSRVYPPLDGNRGAVCGSTLSQITFTDQFYIHRSK